MEISLQDCSISQPLYQFLVLVDAELDEFFHAFGPALVKEIKIYVPVIRVERKQGQASFHQYKRMNKPRDPAVAVDEGMY